MEIGLIYSEIDPLQKEARNFVQRFIRERGILADIIENVQPVKSPTIIINGHRLADQRNSPRGKNTPMFPGLKDIERALEQHIWGL
jgi:hypothetical protein